MPFNVLASSPRGSPARSAAGTVQRRSAPSRGARNAASVQADERARRALAIREQIDGLLVGLRMDVNWLDQCLAEQARGSEDAVRTLRMQMRIRCDGMGDQLAQVAANVERIVGDLQSPVQPPR